MASTHSTLETLHSRVSTSLALHRTSESSQFPHLVQHFDDNNKVELDALVSSIKKTVQANEILSKRWNILENGQLIQVHQESDYDVDIVHVLQKPASKSALDTLIDEVLLGHIEFIDNRTNFYVIADGDATPSHLIMVNGVLFVDRAAVLQVLSAIEDCYHQQPVEQRTPTHDALQLDEDEMAVPGDIDDHINWQTLLSDFNKIPMGDTTPRPCITSYVASTAKVPTNNEESCQSFEHLRLLVLAAWVVVLSKHAGTEDVLIGEVVPPKVSSTTSISPKISLIPRRVKFGEDKNCMQQLVSQIANDGTHNLDALQASLDTLQHDPFYSIVEISKQTDSSLFPTSQQTLFRPFNNTSLHLGVTSTTAGDNVDMTLAYDSRVFREGDVRYMLSHLVHAFTQLSANPGIPHSKIKMMTPDECSFVTHLPTIMERERLSLPADHITSTIRFAPDLLSHSLATHPNATAIEWEGAPLYTYTQLDTLSNKLSRYLTDELSVRPHDTLVIFATHSPFVVLAIYAVLKAGAAYLPVDVEMPEERLRGVVEMVGAKVVLTVGSAMEERLRLMGMGTGAGAGVCDGRKVVALDNAAPCWETLDGSAVPRPSEDPDTLLAYVNLTSGSTGLPKGCMITHTNVVRWVVESEPCYKFEPGMRRPQICKLQFDGIVEEIFMTHYVGGTLCMAPALALENSSHDVINSMKITHATLTPTLAMLLDPADLPTMKVLTVTGEPLRRFARERWLKHGITLQNIYGPTESVCGFALETPVRSSTSDETPVGFALGTTRIYLLDPDMSPTPAGCMGEICISGPTVGLGYFGDLEKSKEVFVKDPFRHDFRMYRTGDLGRVNYEGRLSFIGRRDHQIKIHGHRIELSEIESALVLSGTTWRSAADVVTFQDGPRIAAFIAPHLASGSQEIKLALTDEARSEALRLAEFARKKLLSQMVPSIWVPVNALPRTVSGKLNRKMVKDFFHGLTLREKGAVADFLSERREIVAPSTEIEKTLHKLWCECLNVAPERIGICDSLYSLGADSLSVVRLAAAHKKAGFDISVVELKTEKTIANVVKVLSHRISATAAQDEGHSLSLLHQTTPDLAEHGISAALVEDVIPATPFQQGILLHPESSDRSYMTCLNFVIEKQIDPKRFSDALDTLMMAHPILRTAFMLTKDHSIVQVILSVAPRLYTLFVDDSELSLSQSKSIAGLFSQYEWGRTPLHFVLLYNSKGPSELLCFIHHALFDGWSFRLLIKDLMNIYDGSPVPTRSSWHDFVKYSCHPQESSSKFWKTYLEDLQTPMFCKSGYLSRESQIAQKRKEFKLDMRNTSKSLQVMDSVLMYAAWALVQYIHSGDEDIVFGLISSGRDAPLNGILDMVGPCVAYFPMRINFSTLKTFRDLVRAIQSVMAAVHQHQHIGASAIRKNIAHGRHFSNVDFVLQNLDVSTGPVQPKPWIYARRDTLPEAGRELTIEVEYHPDHSGFQIGAVYDRSAVMDEEIDCMLGRFGEIVKLSSSPDIPLDISRFMVPGEEEQVILRDETHVIQSQPELSALEHFLTSVQNQPNGLAIDTDGGVQITYSELDALSTLYWKKLTSMGVIAGDVVMIRLDKRPELILSVLGCFKAGICFSMTSTDYPSDRFQNVVQDLKPVLIISSNEIDPLDVPIWDPSTMHLDEEQKVSSTLNCSLDENSLAYIVMTSGTTGPPKPIGISRANLNALIAGCGPDFYRSQRRCLFFNSVNYDASIMDIFGTLCFGGCICLASDAALREDLPGAIRRMRVEVADLAPTVARLLVDEKFDTLKVLAIGGESFTADLRDRLLSTGISEILAAYGPAECTVECFRDSINNRMVGSQIVSLGRPFGRTVAVVVDNKLRPIPFGAVGELCIGGPQVSTGYVGRPEVTAQAFVNIEVAHGEKMAVYRSGDMVRLLPNRTLVFVGRRDRQVKVRGVRVEPGEVESSIRELVPGTSQVVVAPIKNRMGAQDLAAFLVMEPGAVLDTSKALTAVRARALVPPAKFIVLPRLPFNLSGKLDMNRLQCLYEESLKVAEICTLTSKDPQTPNRLLAAKSPSAQIAFVRKIWATVLNIQDDAINPDASFQELGGDSLKWMQLSMQFLRAKQKISLSALMSADSVRRQAELVKK